MQQTTTWQEVESAIRKFSMLLTSSAQVFTEALNGRLLRRGPRRYLLENINHSFKQMEIVTDDHQRVVFVLFKVLDHGGHLGSEVNRLGEPVDIDLVSPPVSNGNSPKEGPNWRHKYNVCHIISGSRIWFGIEEDESGERLVNVVVRVE